jgi:uncharacterized protein (TIGR02444 family)
MLVPEGGEAQLDGFEIEIHEPQLSKFARAWVMSEAAAEFWRFSVALYGKPGVAPACLVLQDQYGRDVNLALYCCWVGLSGRGTMSPETLSAADQEIAPWRQQVVEHLRAARRAIKQQARDGSDSLYAKAKAIELEAERLLQTRLAALAPAASLSLSPQERLQAAIANLTLYVGDAPADPLHAALRAMVETNLAASEP